VNAWCAIIESKANGKIPEICKCAREIAGVDNVKAGDGNQAAQSSDPEIRTRAALDSESESEDGESNDDEDDEDHGNSDNKGHDDRNSNADDHGDDGDIDSADDGDTHNNNRNIGSGTNDTSSAELSELSELEADHSSEYDMDNREIEVKQEKVGAKVSRDWGRK